MMARTFLLSCMGPIDAQLVNTAKLAKRLGVDPQAAVIRAILSANIAAPCLLNVPDRSLPQSRALDKILTALGIMSQICYMDPAQSKDPILFVNQRLGPRREPYLLYPATSSHEMGTPSQKMGTPSQEPHAFMAPRKNPGRRKDDL